MKIITCSLLGVLAIGIVGASESVLVDSGAPCAVFVPTAANGGNQLGSTWTEVAAPENIASWTTGTTGIGFDTGNAYKTHFQLDLIESMRNENSSVFLRVPFTIGGEGLPLSAIKSLTLQMKYDDGFVAFLNGTRIADANAEDEPLAWNSEASSSHSDSLAIEFVSTDASAFVSALRDGENVLAIQGLNTSAGNSDFLISPRLVASDQIPPVWPTVRFSEVFTRFSSPVALKHANDGVGDVYVVEQSGRIQRYRDGQKETFLSITDRVMAGGEQGLLGLAFSPNYRETGHIYVYYTREEPEDDGATVVSRFDTVAAVDDAPWTERIALPDSEEVLLVVDQPFANHNGGDIHFGPDGFLYIGLGDGGSGNDPQNHSQRETSLLGKMLRIDVEGAPDPGLAYAIPPTNPFVGLGEARPEIWSLGLRNPWRWSFDRETGDMYIGDVGQNAFEEIDFQPAASSGGRNYAWRRFEGTNLNRSGTDLSIGIETEPIINIRQSLRGDRSITGGFVYRGERFPRMHGIYIYADYVSGNFFGAQRDAEGRWVTELLDSTNYKISAFGEDEAGELYAVDLGGRIYQVQDARAANYLQITDTRYDAEAKTFSFSFGAEIGDRFQAEMTLDGVTWSDVGEPATNDPDAADPYTITLTVPVPSGELEPKGSGSVVMKGKKILQN